MVVWNAYTDYAYNWSYHYAVGLLIPGQREDGAERALDSLVEQAATDYGISAAAELNGFDLFHGEGDFGPLKSLARARVGIYASVFQQLVAANVLAIIRAVHTPGLARRFAEPLHPHAITMSHLVEEIDNFCLAKQEGDAPASIMAIDNRESRRALSGLKVADRIRFVDRKMSRLLQAADMVVFLALRWERHRERDSRNESAITMLRGTITPQIVNRRCWYPTVTSRQ